MFKALIFDMDGVLIDSEPLHKQIEQEILKELGVNVSLEEHFTFAAMGKVMWDVMRQRYGFNRDVSTDDLHLDKEKRYLKALTSKPILPIDGLKELVTDAKAKGILLAVASSSGVYNINLVLDAIGLKDFFTLIVSGEQVPRNKPYPDIYLKTAELLKLDVKECAVIEDSANGVKSAKAAGMYVIGFRNPSSGNQDISPADAIVDSLREVEAII